MTDTKATSLLNLLDRSERLEALPRTGWLPCGVQHPESIAAHSYQVSLLALWLAEEIEEDVDIEEVLRMALLHDLAESLLTDLPAPVKMRLGKDHCTRVEVTAFEEISACRPHWLNTFKAYQRHDTLEARIVKAADQIQMYHKALEYHHQRRGDMTRFLDSIDPGRDFGIPLVGDILQSLRERIDIPTWPGSDLD